MAFGKPAADAEESLGTRIQQIKSRLLKCNSVAEVTDLVATVPDEELVALGVEYGAARPGRSARELAFLHGVRRSVNAEISRRRLNVRKAEPAAALAD